MMTDPTPEIRRHFGILSAGGGVVELRAFVRGRALRCYADDADAFAQAALDADARAATGIFATVNPPQADLLARSPNRLTPSPKGGTTSDDEITRRLWLPLDFDPMRAPDTSATDAEKAAALACARVVALALRAEGWPDPLAVDSGNGVHLLYPVDLPADDGGLVARVLKALSARFSDEETDEETDEEAGRVHLDTAVGNASRILKVAGTWARKGDDTPERPHRRAAFLSVPPWAEGATDARPVVTRRQLDAVAPTEPTNAARGVGGSGTDDDEIREALRYIAAQGRPGRKVWLSVSAATLEACGGNAGRAEALLIEAFGEEKPGEYKPLLTYDWKEITAGTLFHLARKAGMPASRSARRAEARNGRAERARAGEPEPTTGGATAIPARVYDLLPESFRRACSHFEAWHERDVFLTALLGTLSAALPGVRFKYGRTARYLSPHLYFFLLANGAGGKGVADFAFAWLDAIDERLDGESQDARDEWSRARDAFERAKKSRDGGTAAHDPGPEPVPRFIVGGDDTTLGGLYDGLHANPGGLAVLSTEADALSGSNRREFGGFSYLLRKAFHHERATESRRGTGRRTVKKPRLAVVVTGTFDQFGRLLESVQDGLFSRFAVYAFDTPGGFESQRPTERGGDTTEFMKARAADADRLFKLLDGRGETPLYVDVSPVLWDRVDAAFRALDVALYTRPGVSLYLAATVKRGALIAFRLTSVLAVWRAFDAGVSLGTVPSIAAQEADVDAAILLATTYAEHALAQAAAHGGARAAEADMGGADRMTGTDRAFLDALPDEFDGLDMVAAAAGVGYSKATAYRRVDKWIGAKLIRKHGQNVYAKGTACENCETEKVEKTAAGDSEAQTSVFSGVADSQVSQGLPFGIGSAMPPPMLAPETPGDDFPPVEPDPF